MLNKIKVAYKLITSDRSEFIVELLKKLQFIFPDKLYLQLLFHYKMGYKLNLKNPKTFSEKIQWLKLYNRNPLYTTLVDKYAVKKWVADKIGEKHIVPMLGVWDNTNEIDFESLPDRFVLKTTNGGGGNVIICKDKSKLDKVKTIKLLNRSLKNSIYNNYREWPYKNVPPRIIAEKYIENDGRNLYDYKFYCFNGKVHFCQVIRDRYTKETIDFYDMAWNHMPFVGLNPVAKNGLNPVAKPQDLKKMVSICEKLSEGFPFIRVDLYNVDDKIYFGELTFYPASGFGVFEPDEWNYKLGDLLNLPNEVV